MFLLFFDLATFQIKPFYPGGFSAKLKTFPGPMFLRSAILAAALKNNSIRDECHLNKFISTAHAERFGAKIEFQN